MKYKALTYNDNTSCYLKCLPKKKPVKLDSIALSNAVPNPRAMMIKCGYTMITLFTMLASQRL
jgi:hypothetical protein